MSVTVYREDTRRSSRDRESGLAGCFPRTNDNENACLLTAIRSGLTAGTVSNIRGSVRASRVAWSIEGVSCNFNLEKPSVRVSLIAGRGLLDDDATGCSMSSVGLFINSHLLRGLVPV